MDNGNVISSKGSQENQVKEGLMQKYNRLLNKIFDVTVKDDNGNEVSNEFHQFARFGFKKEMVEKLKQLDKTVVSKQLNFKDTKGFTPLHYAVEHRHVEMCKLLLENGADVNACDNKGKTVLHIAAYLVDPEDKKPQSTQLIKNIFEVLFSAGAIINTKNNDGQTPLHCACLAGNTEAVRVFLQLKADVMDRSDYHGWNALDFAIHSGNPSCARLIIESQDVNLKALKNRSSDIDDDRVIYTPMRGLIRSMPEVAEEVFSKCMEDMGKEVVFENVFLDDEFSCKNWIEDEKGSDAFDEEGRVEKGAVPYTDDLNLLIKNHPLNIMVEAKRKNLLRHPLVVSLLNHKWRAYVKAVFYLNMLFYAIFMGIFNAYMLTMPPPYSINSSNVTPSCVAIITEAQLLYGPCYNYNFWTRAAKYFVIILSALNLVKEFYQLYSCKFSYFLSFTNLLEVSLYSLSILTVYSDTSSAGPNYVGVREDWQWQVGAICIFLSWMVLIMFVRNVPTFGIYVLMLNHVLRTFVEFFVVFVLFILGFAFSFHCLLQNQYAFREWWNAVIKTSLMMIGEFQFEAVFVAEVAAIETAASDHTITVSTVNYRAVSYILFVIFLIIMSIIIMNLLVGLAVDDIKGVQKNAELEYLAMKVKLTLDVEYSLPQFIRRRLKRQYCWFYPDKYRKRSAFIQWLFSVDNLNRSTINKALNPEKNKQEILEKRVNSIDQNVDSLDQKVESMNQKYESLDKKVDSLEQKVESMNQKVESVDQKVESLNQKVESMDQKYESMNQKVESVDQKVGSVDQKIESMNQKVYSMDQNVESVKEMITAILSHFKICEDKVVKEDDINS